LRVEKPLENSFPALFGDDFYLGSAKILAGLGQSFADGIIAQKT
jgi:hypothetical protein